MTMNRLAKRLERIAEELVNDVDLGNKFELGDAVVVKDNAGNMRGKKGIVKEIYQLNPHSHASLLEDENGKEIGPFRWSFLKHATASRRRVASASRDLANQLPQGSGIDYDWSFEKVGSDSVKAENGWHYMNPNGYYVGGIPFTVILKADGSFDGPQFDVDELAKSDLGKEIAFDIISDGLTNDEAEERGLYDSDTGEPNYDAVSDEDIKDTIEWEISSLSDHIWEVISGSVTPAKLGAAVKAFLED